MSFTIAIDGPVGAGKSSISDGVASQLGILHLDTGAMYRALGLSALRRGIALDDAKALGELAKNGMPEVRYEGGKQLTLIDGEDVSPLIRTQEISMAASTVSKLPEVRGAMVAAQRALAERQSILLDGRDIGTTVLPNATLKIYLTASAKVRAKRRYDELHQKGDNTPFEQVLKDVEERDRQDMTREVEPLRPADDAQILDSSELTPAQVIDEIIRRLDMKRGHMPKPAERFTFMYRLARGVASVLMSTIVPVSYHNVENAQLDAPYILLANHQSMLDPMVVALKCYRYQMIFLGKRELEKNPILKRLFKSLRMIAVDRHNMDMAAMRACLKTLSDGHPLGIFPEGTRHKHGTMVELESGIAMMALRSGARLLPVYIKGKPRLFRRAHAYYGQPISISDIAERGVNRESCAEVLELITQTYRDMAERCGG